MLALERSAASPAYGARLRARARADLAQLQARLSAGDFAVGQRIFVRVDGAASVFNDTLTVLDSLILDIPGVRRVRLAGVLRSELEPMVLGEVRQVVLNARVNVRLLTRVAVLGAVTSPGFFAVPAETLLDQMLAFARGPAPTAAIERLRVVRGDTVLMQGQAVLAAIADGRTLEGLDLRDGDALVVPLANPPWDRASLFSIAGIFLAPLITILVVR